MNERINLIAEQAGLKVNADGEISPAFFGSVDEGYRKFAELIVKECARYMYETYPHSRYEINYMRKHMGDPDWNKSFGVKRMNKQTKEQIEAGAKLHSDKGYEESTLEKQQEFAKARNYPIPPSEEKFKLTRSSSEKFFPNK
jgi:hypothetical protein